MIKFSLGQIVATPGALEDVPRADIDLCLVLHAEGLWGDLCEEDKQANDEAVENGDRILSAYKASNGTRFWIITEADRSATTILLPSEY